MSPPKTTLMLSVVAMAMVPALAPAQARLRHHTAGHSVRAKTGAQHRAPGVTQELAPDAKQSATGGPAGGVPARP